MDPMSIISVAERLAKEPHAEIKLDGLEVTIGEYTAILTGNVCLDLVHRPKKKEKGKK